MDDDHQWVQRQLSVLLDRLLKKAGVTLIKEGDSKMMDTRSCGCSVLIDETGQIRVQVCPEHGEIIDPLLKIMSSSTSTAKQKHEARVSLASMFRGFGKEAKRKEDN